MTAEQYAASLGCLTAWREERGNGLSCCVAVLFVIRNRTLHPHFGFPTDWVSVITQKNAFSSMTVHDDPNLIEYPDPRDPLFQKLLAAADSIMDGTAVDRLTNGALYYADLSKNVTSGWFKDTIVGNPERFPRVAAISTTTFFGQNS